VELSKKSLNLAEILAWHLQFPKKFRMKRLLVGTCLILSSFSAFSFNSVDSASYYVNKAKELAGARKVWEADKTFKKALEFNASGEVRIAYGDYLVDQRKYFAAVEQYGKVLETNLNNTLALEKMTDVSFQLHRWNDVVMYGNKLLQNGNTKELKYMIGKSYYELENYGQAQKYLTVALQENPRHLQSVTLLGKVLIELSNYKQAIEVYNKTLQLDPNNYQLTYELGLLYYTMNDYKQSIKYFEDAAVKGYKPDLDYYENLGLAYLDVDLNKGVATLEKVLQNKPGDADILFQIGQSYFKTGKYQEAANTYYKVYENNPLNSRALYMTGLAYQKKGDKNKGVMLCEQAIKMDPSLAQLKTQKAMY
jgi:tetratricopeptide (TPR) repeat protein